MMAMTEPKGKDALHVCSGVFLFFETVFCGTSRPEGYPMPFRCGRVSRDVPKRRVDKTSERARSAPAVWSGRREVGHAAGGCTQPGKAAVASRRARRYSEALGHEA